MIYADPPDSVEATLERLSIILPDLAKRMRQCGEYMIENHDHIAFATVAEIAEKAGVQPSAMMRFCNQLGFSGYSEMQKLFRQEVSKMAPDYSTRLANLRANGDLAPSRLLAEFVEAGRYSLEKLAREIHEERLDQAVEILGQAGLIHIVGYRRAFPVASCLSYTFEKLGVPNMFHDDVGKVVRLNALRPDDALIAITFAPYTAGTVEIVEHALKRGVAVVAISDTDISPVHLDRVCLLKANDVDVGDFRSLSASINLAMALAVSVGSVRERPGREKY